MQPAPDIADLLAWLRDLQTEFQRALPGRVQVLISEGHRETVDACLLYAAGSKTYVEYRASRDLTAQAKAIRSQLLLAAAANPHDEMLAATLGIDPSRWS